MDLRERIITAALSCFQEKGIRFTMDDIAASLSISKKTIYTVFRNKQDLGIALADYVFAGIKEAEAAVMQDDTLSTTEKLRKILGVMPENYMAVDFRQLYPLREKYPAIYDCVENHLQSGWDDTISLLLKGMEEGSIRKIEIPVFKLMFEATLAQFFQQDILVQADLTYNQALEEVVGILVDGILTERN